MTIYDVIRVMDDTLITVFGSHDNELFRFWSLEYFEPESWRELPLIRLEIDSLTNQQLKMITDRKITWIERTDKGLDIYIEDEKED